MDGWECQKLEKKYNQLIDMIQESFEMLHKDYINDKKRKDVFLQYKKGIYKEIQDLKIVIKNHEEIINKYKIEYLELKKENFFLKNKFKHLSNNFKSKKEMELLDKYFPQREVLEKIIVKTIHKIFHEKIKIEKKNVLIFRKYFKIAMKDFLTQNIKHNIGSEKLAMVVAQIILKEYDYFIYTVIAKELVEKIERYEEFVEVLIKEDLLDKENKYSHLKLDYTIDDIKVISRNYNKIAKTEDISMISTKAEIQKIEKEINHLLEFKSNLNKELEDLKKSENNMLAEIVIDDGDNQDYKDELENIDNKQKELKKHISKIDKNLTNLANRKLFLTPLLEVKENKKDDMLEMYIKRYEKLVSDFSSVLKEM